MKWIRVCIEKVALGVGSMESSTWKNDYRCFCGKLKAYIRPEERRLRGELIAR